MTNNTINRLKFILGILLSASILISGICLIGGCLTIYSSGDQPYSREAVADTFKKICVPVYVCLALTVITFIVEFLAPSEKKKDKFIKNTPFLLRRLNSKKELDSASDEIISAVINERKKRSLNVLLRTVLLCFGSVIFLYYALDPSNYHQSEINSSMISAMWVLAACLIVPFIYSVFTVYYSEKSMLREMELLKQAPLADSVEATQKKNDITLIIKLCLLVLAVAFIIYGFVSGGPAYVLAKAVKICTECIGLG